MSNPLLRVATFNIHHGAGRDGKVDLGRTAEVIRALDVDLIALQELDVGLRRSRNADQPAELAELLGMHLFFAPAMELDQGEYGIALAAHEEFRAAVEPLPRVGGEEPRLVIVASWKKIEILTTHLSRSRSAREVQTRRLAELAAEIGSPTIVIGDLNQGFADLRPLLELDLSAARPDPTFLSRLRRDMQIDHVLVSRGIRITEAKVHKTDASDHHALSAAVTNT